MEYHHLARGPSFEYSDLPVNPWPQKAESTFCDVDQFTSYYPIDSYHAPPSPQLPTQPSSSQTLFAYPPFGHLSYSPPYPNPPSPPYDSSNSSSSGSSATICSDGFIPSSSVTSPESILLMTPEQHHCDLSVAIQSPFTCDPVYGSYEEGPCVTMQNVQGFADADDRLDERESDYNHYAQPEEVVPVTSHELDPGDSINCQRIPHAQENETFTDEDDHIEVHHKPPVTINTHRAKRHHASPPPITRRKIVKTPQKQRQRRTSAPSKHSSRSSDASSTPSAYPCPLAPYGCPKSFGAKNEWKRHAYTKHFCLSHWRCDQCPEPTQRPNDFNRKDLFIQHVRRMHPPSTALTASKGPKKARTKKTRLTKSRSNNDHIDHPVPNIEETLNQTASRCHVSDREAPHRCSCVFCDEVFEGPGCLEARMEHIGRHMEENRKEGLLAVEVDSWRCDAELESWLVKHGLVVRRKGGLVLS